jgi:hypothetical protein
MSKKLENGRLGWGYYQEGKFEMAFWLDKEKYTWPKYASNPYSGFGYAFQKRSLDLNRTKATI